MYFAIYEKDTANFVACANYLQIAQYRAFIDNFDIDYIEIEISEHEMQVYNEYVELRDKYFNMLCA